jgi:hypothetical protein
LDEPGDQVTPEGAPPASAPPGAVPRVAPAHGFTFESFEVSGSSRAAFETCRRVAEGAYEGPRPVVLLGPPGAGKTHLLWAIVQRIRAGARPTGLALVMAGEFPDKVRRLAADPRPIRQGKPAVLLVDALQGFSGDAPELEAVVLAFLDHGHTVVLATRVHPDRIETLSPAFKGTLRQGRCIELRPREALAAMGAPPDGLNLTDIWRELSLLRRERDELERELRSQDTLRDELEALRARLRHSQAEEERLNRLVLEGGGTAAVPEAQRARLARAEAEAAAALAEQARLQGLLGAARRALETAQAEADQYRAALDQREGAEALARSDVAQMEGMLDEAHAALGRFQIERDTARGRVAALEFELEKARRQLALQAAEMDALRGLAADQSAMAHAEAQALRQENAALVQALDAARDLVERVDTEASRLGSDLAQLADRARGAGRALQAAGAGPSPGDRMPLPAPESLRQRLLFDADLFESVPGAPPPDRPTPPEAQ